MLRDILNCIAQTGIVSIIRGIDEAYIDNTVKALYNGGIRNVEITFDTPGAVRMIENVKNLFGEKMLVGAGTVLDAETARTAILSGADFILSPSLSAGVIEMCSRYGKLAVPGVLTPTEIITAWELGAQLVKIFPAGALGPTYIKDIKAPLKQIEIMAVGGINISNAAEFIRSGAMSVGVGSELVNRRIVYEGNYDLITKNSIQFVESIKVKQNSI
ncbi:bifunctional 4-hydroxy-2-oxoglutarate aldolase/2-dehydro-3-deoxy-phosphogluconate aldolase [Ruminiclostridium cellobioparum]|uniref:bifunctional 4-hydroxy-2-oxoglutarate aldolase/2-dehydro-3-deoxy-phosphogluconate aldolase n=1 Tax=Ruminiclostridium cellobioparum TaxID=29355 RepID=UPI0028ABDA74|nr:bifunctional 4-hydroxy-2-oxoglutarate aldolase/2-dehydro-3-deoxy-phosphogluconate aldolase [Ruminiclostridium cellobioparum]